MNRVGVPNVFQVRPLYEVRAVGLGAELVSPFKTEAAVSTCSIGRHPFPNIADIGLYLAGYHPGGLVSAALLSQVLDWYGWVTYVTGVGVSLAGILAVRLELPRPQRRGPE